MAGSRDVKIVRKQATRSKIPVAIAMTTDRVAIRLPDATAVMPAKTVTVGSGIITMPKTAPVAGLVRLKVTAAKRTPTADALPPHPLTTEPPQPMTASTSPAATAIRFLMSSSCSSKSSVATSFPGSSVASPIED